MDNKDRSAAIVTYIMANKADHKFKTLARVAGVKLSTFSRRVNKKNDKTFTFAQLNALIAYLKPFGYNPSAGKPNVIGDAITEPDSRAKPRQQADRIFIK